jgi:hypothetical protein
LGHRRFKAYYFEAASAGSGLPSSRQLQSYFLTAVAIELTTGKAELFAGASGGSNQTLELRHVGSSRADSDQVEA